MAFRIPKKKTRLEESVADDQPKSFCCEAKYCNIEPSTSEFDQISSTLRSTVEKSVRRFFKITNIRRISNEALKHKFDNFKKKTNLKEESVEYRLIGHPNSDYTEKKVERIAKYGISCGSDAYSDIGKADQGVFLATSVDNLLPFYHSGVKLVVMAFKCIKGKMYETDLNATKFEPCYGYNSHIVRPTLARNRLKEDRIITMRKNHVFHYELDEEGNYMEFPSNILPFAVFTLEFTERAPMKKDAAVSALFLPIRFEQRRTVMTFDGRGIFDGFKCAVKTFRPGMSKPMVLHASNSFYKLKWITQSDLMQQDMFAKLMQNPHPRFWRESEIVFDVPQKDSAQYFYAHFIMEIEKEKNNKFLNLIEAMYNEQKALASYIQCSNQYLVVLPPGDISMKLGLPYFAHSHLHCIFMSTYSVYDQKCEKVKEGLRIRMKEHLEAQTIPENMVYVKNLLSMMNSAAKRCNVLQKTSFGVASRQETYDGHEIIFSSEKQSIKEGRIRRNEVFYQKFRQNKGGMPMGMSFDPIRARVTNNPSYKDMLDPLLGPANGARPMPATNYAASRPVDRQLNVQTDWSRSNNNIEDLDSSDVAIPSPRRDVIQLLKMRPKKGLLIDWAKIGNRPKRRISWADLDKNLPLCDFSDHQGISPHRDLSKELKKKEKLLDFRVAERQSDVNKDQGPENVFAERLKKGRIQTEQTMADDAKFRNVISSVAHNNAQPAILAEFKLPPGYEDTQPGTPKRVQLKKVTAGAISALPIPKVFAPSSKNTTRREEAYSPTSSPQFVELAAVDDRNAIDMDITEEDGSSGEGPQQLQEPDAMEMDDIDYDRELAAPESLAGMLMEPAPAPTTSNQFSQFQDLQADDDGMDDIPPPASPSESEENDEAPNDIQVMLNKMMGWDKPPPKATTSEKRGWSKQVKKNFRTPGVLQAKPPTSPPPDKVHFSIKTKEPTTVGPGVFVPDDDNEGESVNPRHVKANYNLNLVRNIRAAKSAAENNVASGSGQGCASTHPLSMDIDLRKADTDLRAKSSTEKGSHGSNWKRLPQPSLSTDDIPTPTGPPPPVKSASDASRNVADQLRSKQSTDLINFAKGLFGTPTTSAAPKKSSAWVPVTMQPVNNPPAEPKDAPIRIIPTTPVMEPNVPAASPNSIENRTPPDSRVHSETLHNSLTAQIRNLIRTSGEHQSSDNRQPHIAVPSTSPNIQPVQAIPDRVPQHIFELLAKTSTPNVQPTAPTVLQPVQSVFPLPPPSSMNVPPPTSPPSTSTIAQPERPAFPAPPPASMSLPPPSMALPPPNIVTPSSAYQGRMSHTASNRGRGGATNWSSYVRPAPFMAGFSGFVPTVVRYPKHLYIVPDKLTLRPMTFKANLLRQLFTKVLLEREKPEGMKLYANTWFYLHQYHMEYLWKERMNGNPRLKSEVEEYIKIIEEFKEKGIVIIMNEHECDAEGKKIELEATIHCLRQIRQRVTGQTSNQIQNEFILLSNANSKSFVESLQAEYFKTCTVSHFLSDFPNV